MLDRYGQRFLDRVFTAGEIAYCRGRAPNLAARFAAKEAAMKALGTGVRGVGWKDIEVVRAPSGAPGVLYHGRAESRARRLGVLGNFVEYLPLPGLRRRFRRGESRGPGSEDRHRRPDGGHRASLGTGRGQYRCIDGNAGLAVASEARYRMGGAAAKRVVVLVGPGNNGADGLVTARHLRRWGGEVTCYLVTPRAEADPKMDLALEYGVAVLRAADDPGLRRLELLLDLSTLVIDAVLGTGRARPLEGAVKDVMSKLREARRISGGPKVMALDLPTGLNADSGQADPVCPFVDRTLALGFPKAGCFVSLGRHTSDGCKCWTSACLTAWPRSRRSGWSC